MKPLIAEFMAILFNELPVTLDNLVFMGFSTKLIHDLKRRTTYYTDQVLESNSQVDSFSLSLEIRK